jgi:putative endonuclease
VTVNHGVPGSSPGGGAKSKNSKPPIVGVVFLFMGHFIYVIESENSGNFYVGETPDLQSRLDFHNDAIRNDNSTKVGIPWKLFWSLEVKDRGMARRIESHIKRMKSKKYIENLKQFPEITQKLLKKYSVPGSPR